MKQDVDGAATIDEHALEMDAIDAWVQNEGKMPWLKDGGLAILPVERDIPM